MKYNYLFKTAIGLCFSIIAFSSSWAATLFELTITNGSLMPISPAAVYSKIGAESAISVGAMATNGFIQLCRSGNPTLRLDELKKEGSVKFVSQTSAPILPGESRIVEVSVHNPNQESIHFETMYGKTKDVCGVGSVNSHGLIALKQHITTEVIQNDHALLTGAFTEPVLPEGMTYPFFELCPNVMNAAACLRELSEQKTGKSQVRFFAGYFPSLISGLETRFGVDDVQTLLFPATGAIQFKLKLKH